jgi:hypothetical protein
MNGKERTVKAIGFEEKDRLPVVGGFVRHPPFLAAAAGVSVDEFWRDPRRVAMCAFRNLGVDVIIGLILPTADSAIGAQVDIHKSSRFDSPEAILDDIAKLPGLPEVHRNFNFHLHYDEYLARYKDGQADIGGDILWIPNSFYSAASFQNESYFGAENYYMALTLYPEEMNRIRAFFDAAVLALAPREEGPGVPRADDGVRE